MCYHRQSYEESARVASEAIDVDPEHTFANRLRENLYEERHGGPRDLEPSQSHHEEARRGSHLEATTNLGVLYAQRGAVKRAQDLFEKHSQ